MTGQCGERIHKTEKQQPYVEAIARYGTTGTIEREKGKGLKGGAAKRGMCFVLLLLGA
jgi:hypothetical protein